MNDYIVNVGQHHINWDPSAPATDPPPPCHFSTLENDKTIFTQLGLPSCVMWRIQYTIKPLLLNSNEFVLKLNPSIQ